MLTREINKSALMCCRVVHRGHGRVQARDAGLHRVCAVAVCERGGSSAAEPAAGQQPAVFDEWGRGRGRQDQAGGETSGGPVPHRGQVHAQPLLPRGHLLPELVRLRLRLLPHQLRQRQGWLVGWLVGLLPGMTFFRKFFNVSKCPHFNFLKFCNRMDVKSLKGPPFTVFGTVRFFKMNIFCLEMVFSGPARYIRFLFFF